MLMNCRLKEQIGCEDGRFMEFIVDYILWWALVLVVQKLWVLIIRELNSKIVLMEKGLCCENASNSGLCPITVFGICGKKVV